jgi:hypothetical protein
VTLQSTVAELSAVRDELAAVKREKSGLQVKVIQLQAAMKKALVTKVIFSRNAQSYVVVASYVWHADYVECCNLGLLVR